MFTRIRFTHLTGRASLVVTTVFALAVTSLPAASAASSSPPVTWTQQANAGGPGARGWPGMAYDPATEQLVEYGGEGGNVLSGTTNVYNGQSWSQAATAGPGPRDALGTAFDPATGQFLLFGGVNWPANSPEIFSDTWTWDGSTWTQLHPAHSPSARCCEALAYDPSTRQLLLFGGSDDQSTSYSDTWVWTGTDWQPLHPATAPPARCDTAMAYDWASGQLILFGGGSCSGNGDVGDTWTWTGTNWQQLSPAAAPSAREGAGMTYLPGLGGLALFGGYDWNNYRGTFSYSPMNDTWLWKGGTWTQLNPSQSPPGRGYFGAAYYPPQRQLVIFGGSGSASNPNNHNWGELGDTWTMTTPNLTMSPASLPAGKLGKPYQSSLSVNGGTAPYTYSVSAGTLPTGLSLSPTGTLSGTPSHPERTAITVTADDAQGFSAVGIYTLAVTPNSLTLGPSSLPHATLHRSYRATLTASGGTPPYHFAVTHGRLPAGVTLGSTGLLTGAPTRAGTSTVTVTASDSKGTSGSATYPIVVKARTTLTGRAKAAKRGQVALRGTGQPDSSVTLYAAAGHHRFSNVATTMSDAHGRFYFHVHIARNTKFYVSCDGARSVKIIVKR